jgi:transcriptional regulator with XRE-family HTH domain
MDNDKSQVFLNWLTQILQERNLTENQLANKAGIGHSVFTRVRTNGILPKWDTCYKISRALDINTYEIFRAASLIPVMPQFEQQEKIDKLLERLNSLPEERWDLILAFIDLMIKDAERQKRPFGK